MLFCLQTKKEIMKKLTLIFYKRYAFTAKEGKGKCISYYVVAYSPDMDKSKADGYFPQDLADEGSTFLLNELATMNGLIFKKSDFDISVETGEKSFYRWETNSETAPYSRAYYIEPVSLEDLGSIMASLLVSFSQG